MKNKIYAELQKLDDLEIWNNFGDRFCDQIISKLQKKFNLNSDLLRVPPQDMVVKQIASHVLAAKKSKSIKKSIMNGCDLRKFMSKLSSRFLFRHVRRSLSLGAMLTPNIIRELKIWDRIETLDSRKNES